MKFKFKEIGDNVIIYEPVAIISPENITLKSNILISEFAYLAGGQGLYIGNNIHISSQTVISGGGLCVLNDFVGLSAGVRLITGSEDISGKAMTNPTIPAEYRSYYRSFVICEKHSFLATNVVVHPGVIIGEGAVVGSGSVVTKNLDPWGIYIGSPAKRIRSREKDTIIEMEKLFYKKYCVQESNFAEYIERYRKKINR